MADSVLADSVSHELRDGHHEFNKAMEIELLKRCDRLLEHARNMENNRLRRQRLAEYKVGAHFTSFPSKAPMAATFWDPCDVSWFQQLYLSNA
jgi:hypothetical protein